jgi:hypothetical protein
MIRPEVQGNTRDDIQVNQVEKVPKMEHIQGVMNHLEAQEVNRYNLRERRGPFERLAKLQLP